MLRSLKNELLRLSESDRTKLRNKIKKSIAYEKVNDYLAELTDFILCTPDLLEQIQKTYNEAEVPKEIKNLYGFLLTYLYHPLDFLPDDNGDLLGYLDDAYLIGSVYEKTSEYLNYERQASFKDRISDWLIKTRQIIPSITDKMDGMLNEMIVGNLKAFDKTLSGS